MEYCQKYSLHMTDQEIVQGLINRDETITQEFFFHKCQPSNCSGPPAIGNNLRHTASNDSVNDTTPVRMSEPSVLV